MSQLYSHPEQPVQPAMDAKAKRIHYTPELKLQLMPLCANNRERIYRRSGICHICQLHDY
ncbi:hypothetical protein L211DRAFT_839432 [Terfezia boudieri ATCC MYA-4762]|uniref:Uncharacterized protein n=1 Tax=Terfezia boudieri ATCC MYA-4762 TaxID=1051890 RepID=A0A3N4LN20_9PEZI|nr:hypothetical protein L211DRAFT_839432 [Terfezia boudieri ATCC MYA-4762]